MSKDNRFVIDPREQLHAQKWAREKHLKVLGSVHSHPKDKAMPSLIDSLWSFCPRLMVITDQFGEIKAWWMTADQTFQPIEVAFL